MRYIRVPPTITVTPPALGKDVPAPEVVSFAHFAMVCWLDDDRAIAGGFVKQVRWSRVIESVQAAAPGSTLALEDEDYAALKVIVEAPARRLLPSAMVQLLPFSYAVLEAPDKQPE